MSKSNSFFKKFPKPGRFAEVPGGMIDKLQLEDRTSIFKRLRLFFKARIIFLTMFPVLVTLDLVGSLVGSVINIIGAMLTSDKRQNRHIKHFKHFATLFSKSLIAIFAMVVGIFKPDLVTFFFVPKKTRENKIKSGGELYEAEVESQKPRTQADLKELVKRARAQGSTLMPMGAGRSQGMQYIPEANGDKKGILVDMSAFDDVQINEDGKTAIVGGGARWIDIQKAANRKKLALKVMQASNVFSVGGSIGTNIHGWDHKSGTLANVIKWVEIINADGELEHLTPNDNKFKLVMGGFGMFGIVVRAEIELTDNEYLDEKGTDVTIDAYVQYFHNNVENNPQIRMHLYRLSIDPKNLLGNGVAVDYVKANNQRILSERIHREEVDGTRFDRVMINFARRFKLARSLYWQGERKRLLANTAKPLTTNQVMQPPINAMFNSSESESEWLQEYFVPGNNLKSFLDDLRRILTDNNVNLLNCSVRYVKQDPRSIMGYARDEDRFAVVICFNQSLRQSEVIKTKKWIQASYDAVIKQRGSFYLPYQQLAKDTQLEAAYPHVDEVRTEKAVCDPRGVFSSGLCKRYITQTDKRPTYFQILLADPKMRQEFEGFLKNVLMRVSPEVLYPLLDDINTYCETHEEFYTELSKRIGSIMPGPIGTIGNILSSLKEIKSDLKAQAQLLLTGVTKINGLVEIGYPGRFVAGFKENFEVTGPITAVYEQQSITDSIQTGLRRAYDKFVKLDYDKPCLSEIPTNSADVITCYVGLHHFPEEELDTFLADVRRILRKGGHFLLVDHDVTDSNSMVMANMAHSIFNAVTGVSVTEEMQERRNFKPMSAWLQLLAKHDLAMETRTPHLSMVRTGDPSRNTMESTKAIFKRVKFGANRSGVQAVLDKPLTHFPMLFRGAMETEGKPFSAYEAQAMQKTQHM